MPARESMPFLTQHNTFSSRRVSVGFISHRGGEAQGISLHLGNPKPRSPFTPWVLTGSPRSSSPVLHGLFVKSTGVRTIANAKRTLGPTPQDASLSWRVIPHFVMNANATRAPRVLMGSRGSSPVLHGLFVKSTGVRTIANAKCTVGPNY